MSLSGFSLPVGPTWGLGVLSRGLEAPERSGILENPWGPSRGLGSCRGVAAPRRGLGTYGSSLGRLGVPLEPTLATWVLWKHGVAACIEVCGRARESPERRSQAKGMCMALGRARVPELETAQLEPSGLTRLWVQPIEFILQT